LGHPRVYLAIDHTGRVTCGYCGRRLVRDPDRAGQSQLMPPHGAASAEGAAPPPRHRARAGAPATAAVAALGELDAAPGLALAVLLALDLARVAGEKAARLERRPQRRIIGHHRPADAVAHRAGLTGQTAAGHRAHHIEVIHAVGGLERLV